MDAGLKPYERMKDSGVEWLGEVPEHWEVRSLGRIGAFSKGKGGSKEDERQSGVPCIRYGDLYTTHQHFIHAPRSYISKKRSAQYTSIEYGDVLFAASGETAEEIGKSAVNLIRSDVCCGGDIILFRPHRKISPKYLGYATDSRSAAAQKALMGRGFTVVHIYTSQLKRLCLALPPLPEQKAIARFLDLATGQIERYVRAKEKLIALLQEQKQVIIHDAVTGRIDIRTGKPYPGHKPSGIKWLPDIPALWETRRSKQIFWPRKELARPEDAQLSATQAWGVIRQDDYEKRMGRKVVRITQHLEKRRHVEIDDFVISMRSFQGGLERARAAGCIRSSYVVLRATAEIDFSYFEYLFKSVGYIEALRSTADFIRDGQDLNFDNFCKVDLPFPSVEEQHSVAEALRKYIESLSALFERAKLQMALMNEYRTRLIADVVTGKLDVREAAKALPDDVAEANP